MEISAGTQEKIDKVLKLPQSARMGILAVVGVLREAVERRGSSVDDYTAPEGDGEMQKHLDAYQRTGLPCHRCGRPIRKLYLAQRGTHFCSWCQRLPATDRGGSNAVLLKSAKSSARRGRTWSELDGPGLDG